MWEREDVQMRKARMEAFERTANAAEAAAAKLRAYQRNMTNRAPAERPGDPEAIADLGQELA